MVKRPLWVFWTVILVLLLSTKSKSLSAGIPDIEIRRYHQVRFLPTNSDYRLHLITVVENKSDDSIRVLIEDRIFPQWPLVRGVDLWEGEVPPHQSTYDAGYSGYELRMTAEGPKEYIVLPAQITLHFADTVLTRCTDPDTVDFEGGRSDFWADFDFRMDLPTDFHAEKELKAERFLTFTGYPIDPRWIFIWWEDRADGILDRKTVADLRVKIGKELYDQEEDEVLEIIPCAFLNYPAYKVLGNWVNPLFDTKGVFATYGFVDTGHKRLYLIDIITFGDDRSQLDELEQVIRTFQSR